MVGLNDVFTILPSGVTAMSKPPTKVGLSLSAGVNALFNRIQCTHCQYPIDGLRVRCTSCTDFEMCLMCFTHGAEIGPHKNNHPYQFVEAVAMDIFADGSNWSSLEQLSLLHAIEHFSFGNWKDIAQHLGTRNADEVKEEYVSRYLDGSIGQGTWSGLNLSRPTLVDLVEEDDGPFAPNHPNLPILDIRPLEALQLHYLPLRDDFELEYDNLAETLVSPLSYTSGEDDDLDIALKLTQVDMYTERLRERERRHRVIKDYQLVTNFFRHQDRRKISRDERGLRDKLQPLCQFHTSSEHNQMIDKVLTQHRLSRRLEELLRYRKFGLTSFKELPNFEKLRISRHNQLKLKSPVLSPGEKMRKRKYKKKKLLFSVKKIHVKRPYLKFIIRNLQH